jgi:hypothetical protein
VITKLGSLGNINTKIIEGLFSADLAYLQSFYRQINENGSSMIPAVCPECHREFEVDLSQLGE